MLLIPIVVIFSAYLAYTTYRTNTIYNYVKSNQRGWTGHVHRADQELGFVPIANSSGFEIMPIGPDLPMRYNKDGFRATIEGEHDRKNRPPIVLTLGCSFTYGAATHAKDTFPYLIGSYLGGSTKNAGVCSYGLSQMVIIAKRLIPRHKPDYVIVQYSPWLVNRAISAFAPSYFGKLPNPFYSEDGDLVIRPPVFQSIVMELPIDEYRSSRESVGDFFSFLWNVGLPLFLYDDFNISVYTLAKILGLEDEPTSNRRAVIQHAYKFIHSVSEQNGATLVVVILGNSNRPVQVQEENLPKDVILVDAHSAMLERLPTKDQKSYDEYYKHWRGDPPVIVDGHPNEKAHRVIAEEIISRIANSPNKANPTDS